MAACIAIDATVKARALTLDGTPTGTEITLESGLMFSGMDVEFSGVDFVVATFSSYTRLAHDGTILRRDPRGTGSATAPIACDGLGSCFDRVERTGVTGVTPFPIPGLDADFGEVMLSCRPTGCLLVRNHRRRQLVATLVNTTTSGLRELPPFGAVSDNHDFPLVVGSDATGEVALFQRVTETGEGELISVPVTSTPSPARVLAPLSRVNLPVDLTPGAGGYGLVSSAGGYPTSVVFRKLNSLGAQEGSDVPIDGDGRSMAIAWNGTHFLVAFIDYMTRVMVQRIDAAGQRVDPLPVEVLPAAATTAAIDLASFGSEFLLVVSHSDGARGLRIAADGSPIGTTFLIRDHSIASVRVSSSSVGYIASWADMSTGFTELRVARISPAGAVLDVGGRVFRRFDNQLPEFVLNENYVLWAERSMPPVPADRLVYISPLEGTAVPLEVARMRETTSYIEIGLGLTDHSVFYGATGYSPVRMRVRSLSNTSLGATCTAPSDCDSNFCVDGVCCNAACDGACDTCSAVGMCTPMMCDAGMPDANMSSSADAGTTSNIDAAITPPPPSGGCTASSRAPTNLAWLAALGVLLATRRRRSAH